MAISQDEFISVRIVLSFFSLSLYLFVCLFVSI